MVTSTVARVAPVSKSARRMAAKGLGRKAPTDREVQEYFKRRRIEWRDIPLKLAMMNRLIVEARGLVDRLVGQGVQFAGSAREATLVIAGTAYAAWRASLHRNARDHEPAHPALVVIGMTDGIEFALSNKSGIPAMYADDYCSAVADSEDPIDRLIPMEALAELWPDTYPAGRLPARRPRGVRVFNGEVPPWLAQLWENRPNVLTASPKELRKARMASRAEWRLACKASRGEAGERNDS